MCVPFSLIDPVLYEPLLSLAVTGIGVAIVAPEAVALLEQPGRAPGTSLLVGAVIGSVGVFMGSAATGAYSDRSARTVRLAAWTLVGLGLSISVALGTLHAAVLWDKLLFGGAALLPLAGPAVAMAQLWRER